MLATVETVDLALVPDGLASADAGAYGANTIASLSEAAASLQQARSVVAVVDPTDAASIETLGNALTAHLRVNAPCAVVVAPQRLIATSEGYSVKAPFADRSADQIELPFHEVLDGALLVKDRRCTWHIDTSLSGFPALSVLRIA